MKQILIILFALLSFACFGQVYETQLRINPDESTDSTQVMISRDTTYAARFQGRGLWTSIARFGELVSPYISGALSSSVDSIYLSNDTLYIVYFDAPTLAVKTSGLNGVYSTANNAKNLGITTAYYKAGSGLTLSTNAGLGSIGFNTISNIPLAPTGNSASGYGIYVLPNAGNRSQMATAASGQVWSCGSVGNIWSLIDQTHSSAQVIRVAPSGSETVPGSAYVLHLQGDGDIDLGYYRDGTRPYLADWKNIVSTNSLGQLEITSKQQVIDTIEAHLGSGGGDNWGSDVVNHDTTLTGNGTSGTPLKVDTTIILTFADTIDRIATKTDISGITGDNFANADLTFTDNRTHSAAGNNLAIGNIDNLSLTSNTALGDIIITRNNFGDIGYLDISNDGPGLYKNTTSAIHVHDNNIEFIQTSGGYILDGAPPTDNTLDSFVVYNPATGFIKLRVPDFIEPSDTASMLSHYIERGDTAAMLDHYILRNEITQYTDEQAQDAVGGMVNTSLTYVDGTPSLGINLSNSNTWAVDQIVPAEAYDATGWNGSNEIPTKNDIRDKIETLSAGSVTQGKYFTWDGNGGIPAVGSTIYWVVPANITITGWSFWATGASPTATIDVWKIASGTALPSVANTIISGTKPALSSGNAVRSSTLSAFTDTTFTAGEIVGINLDAVTVTTLISFSLEYQ